MVKKCSTSSVCRTLGRWNENHFTNFVKWFFSLLKRDTTRTETKEVITIWVTALVWGLIAWLIPKRLPAHENYVIWWFTSAFALIFDLLVGSTWDLYDYGKSPEVDVVDLVGVACTNPAIAIFMLNVWPKRRWAGIAFAAGMIALLLALELLWLKLGFMRYKGWSIWYSLFCYPFLFATLHLNVYLYRRLLKRR